ncbi:MAG: helix-turn-helix transcriptional regulator, partial [Gemmatimonadaceae bacterium]|nr:helix-turn-helix transcriptional regulator [Gemmatimonadaceae bacterium]
MSGSDLRIAWFPGASPNIDRLRGIVPKRATVVPFKDEASLLRGLSRGGIGLTVIEPGGQFHDLAVRALRKVTADFPQHALIAWCDLRRLETTQLLDVARTGVQDIVRQDLDEMRYAFARISAAAAQRSASQAIARALADVIPLRLRPVTEYLLERADQRISRDAVAAAFGISRRTLHSRLVSGGLPPTRTTIIWMRVLTAAALLEQPGHTLESVAEQLQFHDAHNLGTTIQRYTGHGVRVLRVQGGLDAAMTAFR